MASILSLGEELAARLGSLFYLVAPYDPGETVRPGEGGDGRLLPYFDPGLDLREGLANYTVRAIPVLVLLCALEFVVGLLVKRRSLYRLNDTLCSMSLGLVQILLASILFDAVLLPSYVTVYEKFRLTDFGIGEGALTWVSKQTARAADDVKSCTILLKWCIALLGADFVYYWAHRMQHEFQGLWAAHCVHHSGEDFNLATALRQGCFQQCCHWMLQLLLQGILLGVPPRLFVVHQSLNALTQFWIHTELVFRLPLGLEYIFNSASHHRLHHEIPGNCNYAGLLIVWDRLFGTFVAEGAAEKLRAEHGGRIYGLAEPMGTFNPLLINARGLSRLASGRTRFCARRARHRWGYFSAQSVLKPIPFEAKQVALSDNVKVNLQAGKPRPKYNGGGTPSAYRHLQMATAVGLFLVALLAFFLTAERVKVARAGHAGSWADEPLRAGAFFPFFASSETLLAVVLFFFTLGLLAALGVVLDA